LYNKVGTAKKFIIVDAAMNDLVRPAFYESYHEILTAKKEEVGSEKVDVLNGSLITTFCIILAS